MIAFRKHIRSIASIARDESGNFAIITAFVIPVLIGTIGLAIDTTNLVMFKNKLQVAADTATLAAASALSSKAKTAEEAKSLSLQFLYGQINNGASGSKGQPIPAATPTVAISSAPYNITGTKFTVKMDTTFNVPLSAFARVIGYQTAKVSVTSTSESSTETKNAMSMYFVLDRSGSMGEKTATSYTTTCVDSKGKTYSCTAYYTKIASLKMATASLLNQLGTADPTTKYVRTGAVSYDINMGTPLALAWGESAVSTYVNALTASGGTASTKAFNEALTRLTAASEDTAHKTMNGQVATKYIVFMTDGDNNYASDDTATKVLCDSAKTKKVQVFTVAFMAPANGQALLSYCATDSSHYFKAEDTAQLVQAFKTIGDKAAEQMTILTN